MTSLVNTAAWDERCSGVEESGPLHRSAEGTVSCGERLGAGAGSKGIRFLVRAVPSERNAPRRQPLAFAEVHAKLASLWTGP